MERSSPLAAMQPHALPFGGHGSWRCGGGIDLTSSTFSHDRFGLGATGFNFKDISMNDVPTDYFNSRPSRGASPTAHLAVDLSRNFHIDRSPNPPTPRRSLFNCNLPSNVVLNSRESLVTPPPLPSSPSPVLDSMEISPLPHKAPHTTTIQILSPTPEPTPSSDSMLSSLPTIPSSPLEHHSVTGQNERKRVGLLRPCLSRTKNLTTGALCTRATLEAPPQPFKFGNGTFIPPSVPTSLDEVVVASPDQVSFGSPIGNTQSSTRPKSSYQKTGFGGMSGGFGGMGPQKHSGGTLQRPRKQFRRTLSMFESPADVLNQQQSTQQQANCGLQSIMDVDEAPQLLLPNFTPSQDTIPRITTDTMVDVLDGKFKHHYEQTLVVDCRFEYEYKGGHIDGAINFNDKAELAKKLFEHDPTKNTLLIFHCEYSAHRAPLAAKFIRGEDRAFNAHQYPKLTYPEVYILDGGYSAFFKQYKTRCFPQNYIEMNDKDHANACERGLGRIRHRTKLSRAQTFAFGQQMPTIDDSPTACSKYVQAKDSMMMIDGLMDNPPPSLKRLGTRRMASC